jgi:predicted ATP-dependent Lon-type protease
MYFCQFASDGSNRSVAINKGVIAVTAILTQNACKPGGVALPWEVNFDHVAGMRFRASIALQLRNVPVGTRVKLRIIQ